VCDTASGLCTHPAKPDGTACDGNGTCSGGVCVAAGNCEETGCPECQMCDPVSGCVPDPSQDFCAGFTGQCTNGTCVVCNAATCPNGCCSGPFCETAEFLCFAIGQGQTCRSCGIGQTCNRTTGGCEPPCSTTSGCAGCCIGDICSVGTGRSACGTGGEICENCTAQGLICNAGNCE
jgi:hypothetical protein